MQLQQKIYLVIITIVMGLLPALYAQAGTTDIFSDWQGAFISREFIDNCPEMGKMYEKVAVEAKNKGKDYTAGQIKDIFKKMMHTDFKRIVLQNDAIAFFDQENNKVELQYQAVGTVPDSYGESKFDWYAFEAVGKGATSSPYRYIVMLKQHQHNNGQPHFHLRYGNKGVRELTGESMGNWWPTLVKPDFDVAAYTKNIDPKIMVKVLP